MKKVLLFAVVIAAAYTFTSCKKEYNCTCTDLTTGAVTEKVGKGKNATEACDDVEQKFLTIPLESCVEA